MKSIEIRLFILLLTIFVSFKSLAFNCYMLELGELNKKMKINFTQDRKCTSNDDYCDTDYTLDIPRLSFNESFPDTIRKAFQECLSLMPEKQKNTFREVRLKKAAQIFEENKQEIIEARVSIIQRGNDLLSNLRKSLKLFMEAESELITRISSNKNGALLASKYDNEVKNLIKLAGNVTQNNNALSEYLSALNIQTNKFYPTTQTNIKESVAYTQNFLTRLLSPFIELTYSQLNKFQSEFNSQSELNEWQSKTLIDYKIKANELITAVGLINREIQPYQLLLDSPSKINLEKVSSTLEQISANLESIDDLITKASFTETEKERISVGKENIRIKEVESWAKRNMTLVAKELGAENKAMTTNLFYNLSGPDLDLGDTYLPRNLFGYLACLSDKYSGYVFQMYNIELKDGSIRLVLDVYSDKQASKKSLAAKIQIAKSVYGYYVAKVDEYESGLNKDSQRQALVINLIRKCETDLQNRIYDFK